MVGWAWPQTEDSDPASAFYAVNRGGRALEAGAREEAVRWLDRAVRLGVRARFVRFLLASALAGADEQRAEASLRDLVAEAPHFREAMVALAAARLRAGDATEAAYWLGRSLAQAAAPTDPGFPSFADRVVAAAGLPGWAGMDSAGHVQLASQWRGRPDALDCDLDGRPVQLKTGRGQVLRLTADWRRHQHLTIRYRGAALLGSPIDLLQRKRIEGCVTLGPEGGLTGWVACPADPDAAPVLTLRHDQRGVIMRWRPSQERPTPDMSTPDIGEPRAGVRYFSVPQTVLPMSGWISIRGPDGCDLYGSPLALGVEQDAARSAAMRIAPFEASPVAMVPDSWRPFIVPPFASRPRRHGQARLPDRAGIDIVMPVYRHADDLARCADSLRRHGLVDVRLILVDDASPCPAVRAALGQIATRDGAVCLRHRRNRGFPAAVNTGMRWSLRGRIPRDIVVLNTDTILPPLWLDRLAAAAYSAADIGSVTPMSDDGSIVSYPVPGAGAAAVEDALATDPAAIDRLDALFRETQAGLVADLPSAVGFCTYLRHDCLRDVGLLREDVFAQGYGEENDWSLRARHLGWRNVAALDVFVSHRGGRSFGLGRAALITRNGAILNRLHPGYDAMVADFVRADPLRPTRRAIDEQRWRQAALPKGAVVLVMHDLGGGVARHVQTRAAALRDQGLRAIILRPALGPDPAPSAWACQVDDTSLDLPNLRYALPGEWDALARLLAGDAVRAVEFHHLLGHAPQMADLPRRLGVPYEVYAHDAAMICPRVSLIGRAGHYCGEPLEPEECELCVLDLGRHDRREGSVADLRRQSTRLLGGAQAVIAPCVDTARRIGRYIPAARVSVRPWEDDGAAAARVRPPRPRAVSGPARVCIAGAIGVLKGYRVLLACARDAARRRLELSFTVIGTTMNDAPLLATQHVFITGRFEDSEEDALIAGAQADLGWVPSVAPESWCYALTGLWRAGLWPVAFDLGAQSERIRAVEKGTILPLGLRAALINDVFLNVASGRAIA